MKRRQAIRNIAIATAAAYLLPQCKTDTGPSSNAAPASKLSLDPAESKLLDEFTEALLPKAKTTVKTPETTSDFILAMLNDCYSAEDLAKYSDGLKELHSHIAKQYKTDFGALSAVQQSEIFALLAKNDGLSIPLSFFYETTRSLSIEHFTTSEYFLKNTMHWSFAPGFFNGCATV